MQARTDESSNERGLPAPVFCVIALAWTWLAAVCFREWSGNSEYGHGWLVLALAAYFLHSRLSGNGLGPNADSPQRGVGLPLSSWVLGTVGLLILPVELCRLAPLPWRVFTWLAYILVAVASLAALVLAYGRRGAMVGLFPIFFIAAGIPWPSALEVPLTHALMQAVAALVEGALPLLAIPAEREGNTLVLINCTVGIEEACSGIRSLQSAIMLALAGGEFAALSMLKRFLAVVLGFFIAIGANILRTLGLTLAGAAGGNNLMNHVHDFSGYAALGLIAASIFFLASLMRNRRNPTTVESVARLQPAHVSWKTVLPGIGLGLLSFSGAQGWYAVNEHYGSQLERGQVLDVSEDVLVQEHAVPEVIASTLDADEGAYASVETRTGLRANGYRFYWSGDKNNAGQLYHRPDSCMPMGGWKQNGPVRQIEGKVDDMSVLWSIIPYEKGMIRAELLWTAWMDGWPVPFTTNEKAGVQRNSLWTLVRIGRRSFALETAAVLVPLQGDGIPDKELAEVAGLMFMKRARINQE